MWCRATGPTPLSGAGTPTLNALVEGYRLAFLVSLFCVVAGAVFCALIVRAPDTHEVADLAPVVESVDI